MVWGVQKWFRGISGRVGDRTSGNQGAFVGVCLLKWIFRTKEKQNRANGKGQTFWNWQKCDREDPIPMSTASGIGYDSKWKVNKVVFLMTSSNRDSPLVASSNNGYKHGSMVIHVARGWTWKCETRETHETRIKNLSRRKWEVSESSKLEWEWRK